jgi:NADH:ubiquinone oxidoreductase subunit 6 (subunit J)
MEIISSIFFYIIAGVALLSALAVVFMPGIVYSAVSLIVTFLSVAGIFILLNADFVGVSQIIIYGVGVTIVLLFAIMLTGKKSDEKLWIAFAPRTLISMAAAFVLFLTVSLSVTGGLRYFSEDTGYFKIIRPDIQTIEKVSQEGYTPAIGKGLFTKYVLPFEVLSLLLLAAILGAVVLARKDDEKLQNPTTEENPVEEVI